MMNRRLRPNLSRVPSSSSAGPVGKPGGSTLTGKFIQRQATQGTQPASSASSPAQTTQAPGTTSADAQGEPPPQGCRDTKAHDVHTTAAAGVVGAGGPLPHLDAIQRSFGGHDVSSIESFTGGAAAQAAGAIGAEAYATGNKVAFASAPSLFVAAHEAAHVVQQRAGVQLLGGVGEGGDIYEHHADAVAERVVAGESAQDLLDTGHGNAASGAVSAGPAGPIGERGGSALTGNFLQRKKSSGQTAPRDDAEPKQATPKVAHDGKTRQKMLDNLESAKAQFAFIASKRQAAIGWVKDQALTPDAKKMSVTTQIVQILVHAALGGAASGIARLAEGNIKAALGKKGTADDLASGLAKGAADAGKIASTAALQIALGNATAANTSPATFFQVQTDGFIDVVAEQEEFFIRNMHSVTEHEHGPTIARALYVGLKAARLAAGEIQKRHSLDAWCRYMASGQLGTTRTRDGETAVDLSLAQYVAATRGGQETTDRDRLDWTPGILRLRVRLSTPGKLPAIEEANLSGVNEELRALIAERAVRSVDLPCIVHIVYDRNGKQEKIVLGLDRGLIVHDVDLDNLYDADWVMIHAVKRGRLRREDIASGLSTHRLRRAAADIVQQDLAEVRIGKVGG
jgi:hypothetical protein